MLDLLKEKILEIHPTFDSHELKIGLSKFEMEALSAKTIIKEEGSHAGFLFFTDRSSSRCFYRDQGGDEQTLWIKPEQTFFTEIKSFVSQIPSDFGLQLYEDTQILKISRHQLNRLYEEHRDWAIFGVKLMEHLHVVLIDAFVNLSANNAAPKNESGGPDGQKDIFSNEKG